MEIKYLFLSDYQRLKVDTIELLAKNKGEKINISELAQQKFLSYSQMRTLLEKIQRDLQNFCLSTNVLEFTKGKGKVEISYDFPSSEIYRNSLIHNSPVYKTVIAILKKEKIELNNFCQEIGISKSQLYKKLIPLTKFAKEFGLQFSLKQFDIIGEEFLVRTFLFFLLWKTNSESNWPFEQNKEEMQRLVCVFTKKFGYCVSATFQLKLLFFMVIIDSRVHQNKLFRSITLDELFLVFSSSTNDDLVKIQTNHQEIFESEYGFLLIITFMYNFMKNTENNLNEVYARYNLIANHPIVIISEFLSKKLYEADLYEKELKNEIEQMVFFIIFIQYFFKEKFISVGFYLDFLYYKPGMKYLSTVKKMIEDYDQIIKGFLGHSNADFLSEYLAKLFYAHLNNKKQKETIHIGLSLELAHPYRSKIITSLRTFPNIAIEEVSNFSKKFDFVIYSRSDFAKYFQEIPCFYWQEWYDDKNILELILLIRKLFT